MRVNVDLAICFYLDSEDNRHSFAKQYLSVRNTRVGVMLLDRLTKVPYQALCCLNYITSPNPEDTVRVYTASMKIPKFKMGSSGVSFKPSITAFANVISFLPPIKDE
jgi:hypothetical protein